MKITELYGVLLNALIKYGDLEIECRNPAGDLADRQPRIDWGFERGVG